MYPSRVAAGRSDSPRPPEDPPASLRERAAAVAVAWCRGCGQVHGLGSCPHAQELTGRRLRDVDAAMNWR